MKKFLKVLWITAACMAGLGILITAWGVTWTMRVADRLTPEKSVPMSLPLDMLTVEEIKIDLGVGDVQFKVDDEARVEATGFTQEDLVLKQEGNAVTVEGRDTLGGSHIINLGIFRVDWLGRLHVGTLEKRVVTVYLPKRTELDVLDVDIGVGDVTGKLIGYVEDAHFACGTDDIEIEDVIFTNLVMDYGTGDVTMTNVNVLEKAEITCGTGNMSFTDCEWKDLLLDCGTGEAVFRDCRATGSAAIEHNTDDLTFIGGSWKDLEVNAGTCDVEFDGHLSGKCSFVTSTGDVKLKLNEDAGMYTAEIHVSTGDCDVENAPVTTMGKKEYAVNPGNGAENALVIDVGTGNAEIVFAEE